MVEPMVLMVVVFVDSLIATPSRLVSLNEPGLHIGRITDSITSGAAA